MARMIEKKFNEMSQAEIEELSAEEFGSISPFEKKGCYACGYLKSAISWWCMNPEAIKARGTSIPGVVKCKYWTVDWEYVDEKYKTKENGYVKPEKKVVAKIGVIQKVKTFLVAMGLMSEKS